MKKFAKITGIVLACLLGLLIVVPIAFQGKIKEIVISEGNKMLNAEFGFEDLNISLLRNFPKASVGLEGFWIKGVGDFAADTLASVGDAQVAVNVMSIFGNSGFDITKVLLKDTYLKAIVLEDGRPNWDVMKPSDEEEEEDTTASSFRILLKKVTVDNLNIIYDDRQGNMYAQIADFNATCSGDMAADRTMLDLQAGIDALTFRLDGVPLLSKASINADLNVDADLANSRFTLKENTLSLNAIQAAIDGWVAMPEGAPMEMDIKLNTSDINFKEILSLIPAIYAKDFADLKAEGQVSLHAFAKGKLEGDSIMPQFEASLKVKDGNFRYPALPAGIDDIQVLAKVNNPGGDIDLTEVAVEQLSLNMLGNPFSITAQVKTPISDPDFAVAAKGTLNLGEVKNVYPLEDINLNGILKANMSLGGRLSYLDNEQYERFAANGEISLQNMQLQMMDIPEVKIEKSTFSFTPRYLNLSETKVLIGENDLTADCRFENYMAFALKGKTLKGQLNLKSNHMNVNDFMGDDEEEPAEEEQPTEQEDTTPATESEEQGGAIIVPENIDFNMNVDMAEIIFNEINLRNLKGQLKVKDGTADMSNLSANTMGGSVVINGAYSTAQNPNEPELDAAFALNELSFAQTFKELALVQKMAPVFENLSGNFSGKIAVDTKLDHTMAPQLNTLTASGSLNTRNLNLSGVDIIDKIADATKREELKDINVKDLNVEFTIKDGRIATKPFDIKMGSTTLSLNGTTGLDQTIDYAGKLKLPEGAAKGISTIDLKIGGKFSSPKITIDTQSMAKQAASAATDKALEAVGQKLGIDISNAEKQKEELVEAARQGAQKLVAEAEKQKAALVEKAGSNAIKKLAAEKAGDALVAEAKKQGDKLIAEAEKKGDELIQKAKNNQ
ncbi:MAG: AsmA family protein [Bacteroidaceae bacterium]|nr:AsmA family protein [Bacteroidaceae bacterium]